MHEFRNSETRLLTNCSISTGRQNAVSTPRRETESGYFQLFPETDIDVKSSQVKSSGLFQKPQWGYMKEHQ